MYGNIFYWFLLLLGCGSYLYSVICCDSSLYYNRSAQRHSQNITRGITNVYTLWQGYWWDLSGMLFINAFSFTGTMEVKNFYSISIGNVLNWLRLRKKLCFLLPLIFCLFFFKFPLLLNTIQLEEWNCTPNVIRFLFT